MVIGFHAESGVLNDNAMELTWDIVHGADYILIRHSEINGDWHYDYVQTDNDGHHQFGGLVNGIHYWFQMAGVNHCGQGPWSEAVDPLP